MELVKPGVQIVHPIRLLAGLLVVRLNQSRVDPRARRWDRQRTRRVLQWIKGLKFPVGREWPLGR